MKKCSKTTSGKHLWCDYRPTKIREAHGNGQVFELEANTSCTPFCTACGLVDDLNESMRSKKKAK